MPLNVVIAIKFIVSNPDFIEVHTWKHIQYWLSSVGTYQPALHYWQIYLKNNLKSWVWWYGHLIHFITNSTSSVFSSICSFKTLKFSLR